MNSETYKLSPEGTHIVQQPKMKKPNDFSYKPFPHELFFKWERDQDAYNEQKKNCKRYPISGIVPESWKGKELVEGRDFKLELIQCGGRTVKDENGIAYDYHTYQEPVAIPFEQPKEESQQQLLRNEIIGIILKASVYKSLGRIQDYRNEIDKLKHFSIQRIKI